MRDERRFCAAIEALERRRLLSGAAELALQLPPATAADFEITEPAAKAGENVFAVTHQAGGNETLWGGPAGGAANLLLGSTDFNGNPRQGIAGLTVYHDRLYFYANSSSAGRNGLYTSDGTAAGTVLVKTVGGTGMYFSDKTFALGDRFYFFTHEGSNSQLVVSDGTTASTMTVISLPDTATVPTPSDVIDGKIFFSVSGNVWVTDGTANGTQQVWAGPDSKATASEFILAGGKLFFRYTQTNPQGNAVARLYVANADGSGAAKLNLPGTSVNFEVTLQSALVATGPRVVFTTYNNDLVVSDGTQAGTVALVTATTYWDVQPPQAVPGGKAVFERQSSSSSIAGWWVTDGTSAGTWRLIAGPTGMHTYATFSQGAKAYLQTDNSSIGTHILQSDGTVAGTRELRYFAAPGSFYATSQLGPHLLGLIDGRMVVVSYYDSAGPKLWSLEPDMPTGSISGWVYTDINRDNVREGFEPLRSSYAYVDLNFNGVRDDFIDQVLPATDGNPYFVGGLPSDRYLIGLSDGNKNNLAVVSPVGGQHDINLQAGQNLQADFIIARGTGGVIWGSVYNDANANGMQDPGEAGVKNQKVYVDLNGNGLPDSSEPSGITASDGTYGISGLSPGTYIVRRAESAGVEQTTPPRRTGVSITLAQDDVQRVNFATKTVQTGSIVGTVWTDWNHDGVRDSGDTPRSNATVFLDINGDGVFNSAEPSTNTTNIGRFTFANVNPGQETVRLGVTSSGFVQTSPANGAGFVVNVTSGVAVTAGEFLCYASSDVAPTGQIAGALWLDGDGNGVRDPQESGLSGRTVFIDADNSGTLTDVDSVAVSDAAGNYVFDHRAAGTYLLRQLLPADWEQTSPAAGAGRSVTLTNGQQRSGVDFGSRPVLSAVVSPTGTLQITGTAAADHFTLAADSNNITVTRDGAIKQFARTSISSIILSDSGGADTLEVQADIPVRVTPSDGLGLVVAAGARLRFPQGGVQHLAQLQVDGQLDLADGQMIVDPAGAASPVGSWDGSAYTGLAGLIASGRNGGGWNGSGIVSSSASGNLTTLGVAEASQVLGISGKQTGLFAGETVDATSVLVKYTYGGDANLDGKLNVDDYGRIDFNVPLGTNGWANGDFNYDGKINVDDYGIIDFNVGIQGAPLNNAEVVAAAAVQPAGTVFGAPTITWPGESRRLDGWSDLV